MIKVLHLFTTLDGGGVESFLYNYYSHMNTEKIVFDTVVPGQEKGYLEPIFAKLGGQVFHVCRFKKNPIKHLKDVSTIIRNGKYDIVHCHGYKSTIGLVFAKIWGCKVRIIHSHMAYVNENIFVKISRKMLTGIAKSCSTERFACGIDAAKWLFGSKDYENGKVKVINNAIDLSKYMFDEQTRNNYRKEMCLEGNLVIGNVARLTYQKNQIFLLYVLKDMLSINKSVILLLIGEGEDKQRLEKEAIKLGIEKNVRFLGMRKDVPQLLSAIDYFVLPSHFEGLPVVLAEIQAAGLFACVSDTITREINITHNIHYLSLDMKTKEWADFIIKDSIKHNSMNRMELSKYLIGSKYDIMIQAKKLYDLYYNLIRMHVEDI
ncbi:glycosyltransferase family 1 protein [Massilimicrobiota timonensis]|uniref:glycosyltransferase family 1 protein n=1 Tax=Massilimicrobiota timonensis TaxID=1776392 RepID=UPI00101DA0C0|nr:glycosyltransferase family 1 protein [Massilimicrobiota timonensis]